MELGMYALNGAVTRLGARRAGSLWLVLVLVAACAAPSATPAGAPGPPTRSGPSGTVRLYASVTQNTIDAVVAAFAAAEPGVLVEVFRAPTGELAGRIAAERREGRIQADVFWMTDPLSIEPYARDGILRGWTPAAAADLDAGYQGDGYWGTRLLNVVIVRGADVAPAPATWDDLRDPAYRDAVGLPDPGFAGSALGALGYFAESDAYGLDFYRALRANGAVQVRTPDEVVTGVAEGRFAVGMTLDNSARSAIAKGSPVTLVWPTAGAIAIYSPIAVVDTTENAAAAESFVEFVLSPAGQAAIGSTGWETVIEGVGGPAPEGSQVLPDWAAVFGRQDQLLAEYRSIFGG